MAGDNVPTLEDAKAFAGVTQSDKDGWLESILNGTLDAVDNIPGREFRPSPPLDDAGGDTNPPVTRTYTTRGHDFIRLRDLRDTPDLVVRLGGQILGRQYYDLAYDTGEPDDPGNPSTHIDFRYAIYQYGVSWIASPRDLAITGRWGFLPMPNAARLAVLTWFAAIVARRDARWSDAVQTPEGGVFNYFSRGAPADVKAFVDGYAVPKLAGIGAA